MQKESFIKNPINSMKEIPLDTKKEIAKIGMTASLGVLVATSFKMKSKTSKFLHNLSGATLVGFSLWHHYLYQPEKKDKSKKVKMVKNKMIAKEK